MKKHLRKGIALGVIFGSFITAYALARLFYSQSLTSDFTKKQIFEFDLSADMQALEMGPGDSFLVDPVIDNTATEEMFVFIEVNTPEWDGESLYSYEINDSWTLVESDHGKSVYAYGGSEMTHLRPGESTDALTSQMTMRDISNAEFSEIDDINVTINGYGIDTTGETSDPERVWAEGKTLR